MHFFHYSDMTADLAGEMQRMADVLEIDVDPAILPSLVDAASFDNMKQKADQFAPAAGMNVWKDEGQFFNKGRGQQWLDLSESDLGIYDARMRELLPASDIAWLQNGGELPD